MDMLITKTLELQVPSQYATVRGHFFSYGRAFSMMTPTKGGRRSRVWMTPRWLGKKWRAITPVQMVKSWSAGPGSPTRMVWKEKRRLISSSLLAAQFEAGVL